MAWREEITPARARLLNCKLVTLDERLIRGIERLDIAVRPRDL